MNDSFFRKIESKTGVPMEEVFALANAIQYADFNDERQVRKIIRKVGKLAKKEVPQQTEDELVNSIVKNGKAVNIKDIKICLADNKKTLRKNRIIGLIILTYGYSNSISENGGVYNGIYFTNSTNPISNICKSIKYGSL